jgi:hypothetical protein
LNEAARFVNAAGLAYVFPDNKNPLPSLWGAVSGDPMKGMDHDDWGWTKPVARTWELKDELGAKRKAYFGRFVRGKGTLIALDLLAPLLSLIDADDLTSLPKEAYDRLGHVGKLSTFRLRESLRLHGKKGTQAFNKTMLALYRGLLIANVGADDSETRWPSAVIDRVDRAYPQVVRAARKLKRDDAIAAIRKRLPHAEPRFLATITGVASKSWRP